MLITGNVMVDSARLTEPRNAILEDDTYLNEFSQMAKVSKAHGSKVIMQISHPGKVASMPLLATPVGPSPVALQIPLASFRVPRALTISEIEDLIKRFARTAELAMKAGFDGVQIHGAHGYLISQFLSPIANIRNDDYGGDAKRRMTFLMKIVKETRNKIGANAILSVKLNSADFQKGGFSEEESLDVICELEKAGVDLLEISGGNYESPAMVGEVVKDSTKKREAYFIDFATKVRAKSKIPLMLTGGVRTLDFANQVVNSKEVDIIGIARPFAVMGDAGAQFLQGKNLNEYPEPRKSGVQMLDAYIQIGWHGLLLGDLSQNIPFLDPMMNPYFVLVRAMLTLSFRSATQYKENDKKWMAVIFVLSILSVYLIRSLFRR